MEDSEVIASSLSFLDPHDALYWCLLYNDLTVTVYVFDTFLCKYR